MRKFVNIPLLMSSESRIKGRGAQSTSNNRFDANTHEVLGEYLEYRFRESGISAEKIEDEIYNSKTTLIKTYPKTILNNVNSPDVGMEFSLNPYQGCEHGCVYCYARNSHEYWGFGAGLDFEQKILVKENAVQLLEKKLQSTSWKAAPVVLSGNTDCYQPIESELKLTRSLLEVFLKYKHPVGIITKNALVQRDLDILKALATDNLIKVILSITTLDERTKQLLEPRTASIKKRLQTVEVLSNVGIPVGVMIAPVIPGINSHEILPLIQAVSERGAKQIGHTIVRLNGAIGGIFEEWLKNTYPDRAEKVLHQIADCHGGSINDSIFGRRMRGTGPMADQINAQFKLGKKKYGVDGKISPLNLDLHKQFKNAQLKLWE